MSDIEIEVEKCEINLIDFKMYDYIIDIYHSLLYNFPYLFYNIKSTDFISFLEDTTNVNIYTIDKFKFEKWEYEYKQDIDAVCFYINKIKYISCLKIKIFIYKKIDFLNLF